MDINVFIHKNPYKNCWEYQVMESGHEVVIVGHSPTREFAKEDLVKKLVDYIMSKDT